MADIKNKLRQLRKDHGYNQEDVAFKLGMSTSAYGYYEQGKTTPPLTKLKMLASIYNVSISELTGEPKDTVEFIAQSTIAHTYPYIDNYVSAGKPTTISGMKDLPRIQVPDELVGSYAGSNKLFFLKVNGESMNKVIPNDSVIGIVEYDSIHDLKNGDIVVYSTEDSEFAVKYFYKDGNDLIFRPASTNPHYYDTIFDIQDNIKIIGKVVQYSVTL